MPPHLLAVQPQRPGELCEIVYLGVSDRESRRIERLAAEAGLPTQLWSTLAIEADRAIRAIARLLEVDLTSVIELLDDAATKAIPNFDDPVAERFTAYAEALLAAPPRTPEHRLGRMVVRPAAAVAVKWASAAIEDDRSLVSWLELALERVSDARIAWEVAAVTRGQSLSEWAGQAALRLRRSNQVAQALAT